MMFFEFLFFNYINNFCVVFKMRNFGGFLIKGVFYKLLKEDLFNKGIDIDEY